MLQNKENVGKHVFKASIQDQIVNLLHTLTFDPT